MHHLSHKSRDINVSKEYVKVETRQKDLIQGRGDDWDIA